MKCDIHKVDLQYNPQGAFWYCPDCEANLDEFVREDEAFDRWHMDDDDIEDDLYEPDELYDDDSWKP